MDYSGIIKSAKAALASSGAAISVTTKSDTYDPSTGTSSGAKLVTYTGSGLLKNYRDSLIAEGRVNTGDKELMCIFDDSAFVPTTAHKVLINGVEWGIINIKTLAPGGVAILYCLQVRR